MNCSSTRRPSNDTSRTSDSALSISFIDDTGTIINIADMKPLTTDIHHSARPARYALEMNQGWFRERGVGVGARLRKLPRIQAR